MALVASALPMPLPLGAARQIANVLNQDDRQAIVRQIRICLRDFYVHLPLKMSSLAIDPVQECLNLEDDLSYIGEDTEFFRRLMLILRRVRDRHTTFVLPYPWSALVAYLPFSVEACWENGVRKLLLTRYVGVPSNERLIPGVEITHWNAVPIRHHIELFAEENQGANPFARVAMALRTLTTRSLAYFNPPAEDWVSLTFIGAKGIETAVIPWYVQVPNTDAATGRGSVAIEGASPQQLRDGIDKNLATVNDAWLTIYGRAAGSPSRQTPAQFDLGRYLFSRDEEVAGRRYCYLRIFSFDCDDVPSFLREIAEILTKAPDGGLIIDVRANPGGNVPCGEGLLQLLSSRRIEPQPVSFRATASMRQIASAIEWFADWRPSLNLLYDTGERFSQGFPLSGPDVLDPLQQVYSGPVVIICDGLSYSTTDFFTVGAKDNQVAQVIGVDPMLGAGGANVWQHSILVQFARIAGVQEVEPMPGHASFNFAARRSTRVGKSRGIPVEGLGIEPDYWYRMTRRDVLSNNEDLIAFATSVLTTRKG
ncbi:hypothetical protein ACVWWK_001567 [Bradyrhizobium sp. LB9.1b]